MKIDLSHEESIVLYEFLRRNNEEDNFDKIIIDQSEQRILWNLECTFEETLIEPFKHNYQEYIEKARAKIRDKT